MGVLSGLWKYVAGILAAIVGLLGAALLYTGKQRDRAQEAARVAKANAKGIEEVRKVERNIDDARAQAREKSVETRNEHESRPADSRPTGDLRR